MQNMTIQAVCAAQSLYAEIKTRFEEDRGAVMAEYGLLLALVAVMIIGTLVLFRNSLIGVFSKANNNLDSSIT